MTIGPDIKEAIVEVGTRFVIERDSGDITGEYLNFKSNAQVTKPFIREFFLEAEFCYDTAKLANKEGLYNVYVSNGYIREDPLKDISPFLDAINVDVKAFNDNFYKNICIANLDPVLRTCELIKELNIHLELTYLVIPNHNDSIDEVKDFCKWVVDKLGNRTPVHFSRFHPDYKMTNVQSYKTLELT